MDSISKKDLLEILNRMKSEYNNDDNNIAAVNYYISKIEALDDQKLTYFLQLYNVNSFVDAERQLHSLVQEYKKKNINPNSIQNNSISQFQKISIRDVNPNDVCLHFTGESNLKGISDKGLIPKIGIHSQSCEENEFIFFSKSLISTLQGIDTWLKWIMNNIYAGKYTNIEQLDVYKGLSDEEKEIKQYEWFLEFLNKDYLKDTKKKENLFETVYKSVSEKIYLVLDIQEGVDYSSDDIDYPKRRSIDKKDAGDDTFYLFTREFYGSYSDADSPKVDSWNMHTKNGTTIPADRIRLLTDSNGNTDMLHVIMEMYDLCNNVDKKTELLDDFMEYVKQRLLEQSNKDVQDDPEH